MSKSEWCGILGKDSPATSFWGILLKFRWIDLVHLVDGMCSILHLVSYWDNYYKTDVTKLLFSVNWKLCIFYLLEFVFWCHLGWCIDDYILRNLGRAMFHEFNLHIPISRLFVQTEKKSQRWNALNLGASIPMGLLYSNCERWCNVYKLCCGSISQFALLLLVPVPCGKKVILKLFYF